MCDSPSLFILSVLCVVVSISGQLYFCIFSCDPLLFLSGVLCPSPQAIGALLFLYAVWWDGQKLISFLYSGSHMMEYCLLCCVFSGAVLCCLCCLLWKCVKYQDIGETYPRVVYISVEGACVRMGWMYSIFTIRIKFEIIERLLQSYYSIINIFIWEVSSTISKK